MSWQVLILFSVLTYSVSVLLQRVLVREDKNDPIAFSIVFASGVALVIALYGFITHNMQFPDLRFHWVRLITMMFLYGLGGVFLYTSLQKTEASKFTIIFSSRALFTVFASSILLSEGLNLFQWIGALFIFAGIVFVTGKIRRMAITKSEIFALCAAICFGFAVTNDRVLLQTFTLNPYVFLTFALPAIFVAIVRPQSLKHVSLFMTRKTGWKLFLLCTIYAASALLFFRALQLAPNSSQVITANLTSVVVVVLLSIIFLKERADWLKKIIGAVLSFIGLLLVS